ncbi:MAG: hypothetical protein M1548_06935 [Actinobacteria bacterium]|nr:hypothetical protein [Actinomycetota bacterium]
MKRSFLYAATILIAIALAITGFSERRFGSRRADKKPPAQNESDKTRFQTGRPSERPVRIALIASKASSEFSLQKLGRGADFSYYAEEILHNYGLSFDVVADESLSRSKLSKYDLLIAGGWSKAASAAAPAVVKDFVNSGGVFLSTGWLLAKRADGIGELDSFLGVSAAPAGVEEFRLVFGGGSSPLVVKGGAGEVYGVTRSRGALGFDRIIRALPGVSAMGVIANQQGAKVGDALVVSKRGSGYAVSTGLDLVNTIAAYREPTDRILEYQGPHNGLEAKKAAERSFRNLIEYSLSLRNAPLVYKWNSENGARITVFDRDDIDRPFDFEQIETRIRLRERYGAHGTTYIRVTDGSGLPPLITKEKVAEWERRGAQVGLHSEIVSVGGGNGEALSEARWEKARAEELFGHPVVDEVAHGAKGNSDAGTWEPATKAGFLASGHAVTSYVERLPSVSLRYTTFGIPVRPTFEAITPAENKALFESELAEHGFFGFLSHSEYLPESEYSHAKIAQKQGILASLDDFYSYLKSKGAIIRSAKEIRVYEENRRLARVSYVMRPDGFMKVDISDPSGAVWAAVPGRWSGADAVYSGNETVSLFKKGTVTRQTGTDSTTAIFGRRLLP